MINLTVGIDIGGTKICAAVIENGKIVSEVLSFKTPDTAGAILETVLNAIDDLKSQYNVGFVGIATAGAVNKDNSKVQGSTGNLPSGYSDIEFKKEIETKTGLKTYVENDANAAAYAEYKVGAAIGHENTITVTLGTGIGGGIIVEGSLVRGKSGAGAEVGHMQLNWSKHRKCTCGSWDCWEAYGSGTGYALNAQDMARELQEFKTSILSAKNPDSLTTYDIIEGKNKGDAFCLAVHKRWEQYVLMGLVALANIFDPQSIVVSGGMAQFLDFDKIESIINSEIVTTPIELLHAEAGNHAGMIGAAILAQEKLA